MANIRPSCPPPSTPMVAPGRITRDIAACRMLIADLKRRETQLCCCCLPCAKAKGGFYVDRDRSRERCATDVGGHLVAIRLQLDAQVRPRRRKNGARQEARA